MARRKISDENLNGENENKPKNAKLKIVLEVAKFFVGIPAAILAIITVINLLQPTALKISMQELTKRIIGGVFYEKQQYIFTVPQGPLVCHYSPRLDSSSPDGFAKSGDVIRVYPTITKYWLF